MKRALASFLLPALGAAGLVMAGEEAIDLAPGAGRDVTIARCGMCHSLDYIPMNAAVLDRGGWEKSVHKMIERFGAPIEAADAERIVDYLGTQY